MEHVIQMEHALQEAETDGTKRYNKRTEIIIKLQNIFNYYKRKINDRQTIKKKKS